MSGISFTCSRKLKSKFNGVLKFDKYEYTFTNCTIGENVTISVKDLNKDIEVKDCVFLIDTIIGSSLYNVGVTKNSIRINESHEKEIDVNWLKVSSVKILDNNGHVDIYCKNPDTDTVSIVAYGYYGIQSKGISLILCNTSVDIIIGGDVAIYSCSERLANQIIINTPKIRGTEGIETENAITVI